jgi:hypothetical protein
MNSATALMTSHNTAINHVAILKAWAAKGEFGIVTSKFSDFCTNHEPARGEEVFIAEVSCLRPKDPVGKRTKHSKGYTSIEAVKEAPPWDEPNGVR